METSASRSELSPLEFLRHAAHVMAERTAVVQGARRYSYADFAGRVDRLASALRGLGLQPGDRVAVLSPNAPAILEAHYGVPAAGGILVTINTRLSTAEIEYILGDCTPRALIVDAELRELIDPIDTSSIEVVTVQDTGRQGDPYEDQIGRAHV
jgi:fatty-acyl-CoA synthase